ncbi:MAG: phosphoribosyl-ATP diphosphatase [Parvibaculaceae bacterium]
MPDHGLETLERLADRLASRKDASPESSYTARLLSQGVEKCAKKLGEEAVEAALAAMTDDRAHLTKEAADVLYHLLVVLIARGVPLADVMAELDGRMRQGGLEEKARRTL